MSNLMKMTSEQTSSSSSNNGNKFKSYLIEKLLNETPLSPSLVKLDQKLKLDDKEDLTSETGTYTIEDDINQKNSMPSLDIVSDARAAIDQTFGIEKVEQIEQNKIIINQTETEKNTPNKRHSRIRNQTYSLSKDIQDHQNNSTSSASSSSHSIQDTNLPKIKKTTTYDIISEANKSLEESNLKSNQTSSRTVNTELLLGNTDNLIEELKKRRMDKKNELKSKYTSILNNLSSSSSSTSSSTNLSNDLKPTTWTIPPTQNGDKELESFSTRATVNFDEEESINNDNTEFNSIQVQSKRKGLAFEFNLNDNSENPVMIINSSKLVSLNKTKHDLSSSMNSSINTPKSNATSALSLGAKIQQRAKENGLNSSIKRRGSESTTTTTTTSSNQTPTQATQYTNRTLYLRQQSAKAKRDSMERSINEDTSEKRNSIQVKKTGILKKTLPPTNNLNSSKPNVTRQSSVSKSFASRTNSPVSNNSNLMTSSLNIPSGCHSLPVNLTDSFHRRKNYDPNKSTKIDNNKPKHKELNEQQKLSDSLSDSSFCSHQNQIENSNTYEKILEATLQRLSIRLIQMSTGILDKIGDNRNTLCDSIQFLTNNTNELERMQTLTKLVHSMQTVHDHIQFIDMTVFNKKPEENYIKELNKIRHEVDILKQSAVLNLNSTSLNSK